MLSVQANDFIGFFICELFLGGPMYKQQEMGYNGYIK
jgi:hypothetical protein